jgi:nucleoside-diphosphate-sugar epimerase
MVAAHPFVLDAAFCCLLLQTRSFQYIDDLIRGMVAVMDGDEIGPFNVGNPGEFTMLELADVS